LSQFGFPFTTQYDERPKETRRQPSRAEPPNYFQGADKYTPGFVAENHTRSIRSDAAGKH
jgi:hypothetical protein